MKPRVVYVLIASVWIIAAALLFLCRIFLGPAYLKWQLGKFAPPSGVLGSLILYVFPQLTSAMIVGTNVYLHCTIIQSKKKLENDLKLSGKDEHKVTKLQRLIHNLLYNAVRIITIGICIRRS